MINKTNSCLGVALATLTMAGALVSPQATAASKAERMAEAANSKAEILEAQLRAMQDEIAALRAQVSSPAPAASRSAKNWPAASAISHASASSIRPSSRARQ